MSMRFYVVPLFTCHNAFVRFNLIFRLKLVVGSTRHKRVCTMKFNTKYVYLQNSCKRKASGPFRIHLLSFSTALVKPNIQQSSMTKIQFKTVRVCNVFACLIYIILSLIIEMYGPRNNSKTFEKIVKN